MGALVMLGLLLLAPKELRAKQTVPLRCVGGCLFQFVTVPITAHSLVQITHPASKAFEPVPAHHQPGLCVRVTGEALSVGTSRAPAMALRSRFAGKHLLHFHTASRVIVIYIHRMSH